jgi:GTP cyclohydrolase I
MIKVKPFNMDLDKEEAEIYGDNHGFSSIETPMHEDAFEMNDESKILLIQEKFAEIMNILGLDLNDDSLKGTPYRVAKMFVKEIFSGLDPANKPDLRTFDNKYNYNKILVEKNINVQSFCEHHFLPIIGKAHIGYIPNAQVVGLSKLNRVVDYFCRRPQVQERLTMQILNELQNTLGTKDVIIIIDAKHLCVSSRGIKDIGSSTQTIQYSGKFEEQERRDEFFKLLENGSSNLI